MIAKSAPRTINTDTLHHNRDPQKLNLQVDVLCILTEQIYYGTSHIHTNLFNNNPTCPKFQLLIFYSTDPAVELEPSNQLMNMNSKRQIIHRLIS
jgi:hypothetical protein